MRRPDAWYERDLVVAGGQGVVFTPEPDDRRTALSVEVRDLGTAVVADDLADLRRGFLRGLRSVPGSRLQLHDAYANEFAIGIDAVQTFAEDGQRRKRWIRLLHSGSMQARVIAQGATVREFNRLRPLFAPCLTTFRFADDC